MSPSSIEILAYEPTSLGILCLRRRELLSEPGTVVTEIALNHEFLMSSYNTASERALARTALEMHPGASLNVLVGGLGLGYTAQEALASERVASVEAIELLPQVIDWIEKGLIPLADELKADSRFAAIEGNVYDRLSRSPERLYDLVLIDVDHSPDEQLADWRGGFYTVQGLASAKRHVAPHGVIAVWSYAESSDFADALRATFSEVRVEPVTFRNALVDREETDWLFFARA